MQEVRTWQKATNFRQSFSHAWRGLVYATKHERNFIVQLMVFAAVIILSLAIRLSWIQFSLVMLTAAALLAVEMINTALEMLADVVQPAYHEKIGLLKDITAGAVLVMTVVAVVIGLIIFTPALVELGWLV